MSVVITGATGRIGRVLAGSLADVGLPVTVLTRRPHRADEAFGSKVNGFEWHPISEPVPAKALEGATTIVHLMGERLEGRLTSRKLQRLIRSRVTSIERLIDATAAKPIRLILASSAGLYPGRGAVSSDADLEYTGDRPDSDTDPVTSALQPLIANWETAARPWVEAGVSVTFVRLGNVICTDGFPSALVKLREAGLDFKLPADCAVPVISLQDAAALFAWLVLNPEFSGPVNGVAPTVLKGSAINEALTADAEDSWRWPLSAGLAMRRLGIGADLVCGDRHVEPALALAAGFKFSHPDTISVLKAAVTAQRKSLRNEPKFQLPAAVKLVKPALKPRVKAQADTERPAVAGKPESTGSE